MNARHWRGWALLVAMVAPLAVLWVIAPIAQDQRYHAFADLRAFFGLPHFLNIVSNGAFLVIGLLGLVRCLRGKASGAALSWTIFFAAVTLVALGSAYYHANPSDATLIWDRLPMTIAFMALFAALLTEHLATPRERVVLMLAITVGVASLVWWRISGDLWLYVWVQLAPFLAIAVLLAAFPARYDSRGWLAWGLIFYALAKLSEAADAAIFSITSGVISGHTLKHLLASIAPLCVYGMLVSRKPVATPPNTRAPDDAPKPAAV